MKTRETVELDRLRARQNVETRELRRKYNHVMEENKTLRREVDSFLDMRARRERIVIKAAPSSDKSGDATMIAMLSDWHVECLVKASSVNGLNEYNLAVAEKRAATCFRKIARLIDKERQDVTIRSLVLWLGGDFINGSLHEESIEQNLLKPMEAVAYAMRLLQAGIRFLSEKYKDTLTINVVCSTGNHGRTSRKNYFSTEGYNLEWGMYHTLSHHFRSSENVRFQIHDGYMSYVKVYRYTLRFMHGHSVRFEGGVGGLHVPLNKALHRYNATEPADITCLGHHHTYIPASRYVVNGSMIGYTPFALGARFEYEPPRQACFLLDSKRGVTAHLPIIFD